MTPEWLMHNEKPILESDPDNGFEPSGLTIYMDSQGVSWLYLVSDNGKIARRQLGGNLADPWMCADFAPDGQGYHDEQSEADTQFEAVTVAGNKLMIGIEGDAKGKNRTPPRIRR